MSNIFDDIIPSNNNKQAIAQGNMFDNIIPSTTTAQPIPQAKTANIFDDILPSVKAVVQPMTNLLKKAQAPAVALEPTAKEDYLPAITQPLKSLGDTANAVLNIFNPTQTIKQKIDTFKNVAPLMTPESLEATSNAANLGMLIYGAAKAPELLDQLKEELGSYGEDAQQLYRQMTIKSRELATQTDEQLMNTFKQQPEEIQSQMAKYNPRIREMLQKSAPEAEPIRPNATEQPISQAKQPVELPGDALGPTSDQIEHNKLLDDFIPEKEQPQLFKKPSIESAAVQINGKTYEAPDHISAVEKARQAGETVPPKGSQEEWDWKEKNGLFKTSDNRLISRQQADKQFGVTHSEEVPKLATQQGILGNQKGGVNVGGIKDFIDKSNEQLKYSGNVSDDYYKLEGQNESDRVKIRQILEKTDISAKDQEAIYNWIENPKEPITTEQKKIYDESIAPIREERNKLFAKLRNEGVPVPDEGYTPRKIANRGGFIDRLQQGYKGAMSGGLLRQTSGELKNRVMKAIVDEKGNKRIVAIKNGEVMGFYRMDKKLVSLGKLDIQKNQELLDKELQPIANQIKKLTREQDILFKTKGRRGAAAERLDNIAKELYRLGEEEVDIRGKYDINNLNDKKFIDKNGKPWTIKEATTKEIEANTNLKYHKTLLLNELEAWHNLKKVDRAIEYLENLKNDPEFKKTAIKIGTQNIPEDYKTTILPQLRSYAFPKRVAETFDTMFKNVSTGLMTPDDAYAVVNRFLRNAIFFNPLIHIPNITVHAVVNRGLASWFIAPRYINLVKTGRKAIEATLTMNKDYTDALEKGTALLYSKTVNRDLYNLMLKKMGTELEQTPTLARKIGNALGYANPKKLIKAIYDFSGKATWAVNDIATLQSIYEEMGHGKTFDEAMKETGKHIPTYRIPPRVLNSTALSKIMKPESGVTMFGGYHYGAMKSYGEMAKTLIGDNSVKDKAEALDKIAMLALITYFIYPELDKFAKKITGNKNASFRRAGASTFPYKTQQYLQGKIPFSDYLQSALTQYRIQFSIRRNYN